MAELRIGEANALQAELKTLHARHSSALELMGERDEQVSRSRTYYAYTFASERL